MRAISRPHQALAALTVLVLLLAGCIGSAEAGTAKSGLSPAEAEAKKWDSGAELAGIIGAEGTFHFGSAGGSWSWTSGGTSAGTEFSYLDRGQNDPRVGDGKCEVWIFRYIASGKTDAFVVVVDKDGKVLKTDTDDRETDDRAVGDWRINSDEALRIAKDANAHLKRGVESQYYGLYEGLRKESASGNAKWFVAGGGGDSSGGGGGYVEIDAVTGRVLRSDGGSGGAV